MTTFEDSLQKLLIEYDKACLALRNIHADTDYLNPEHATHKDASSHLMRVTRQIFDLKNIWMEIKNIK